MAYTPGPLGGGGAGVEWVVEAFDCDPGRLTSVPALRALFSRLVADLALQTVGDGAWHQFPPPGCGVTGLALLAESHLAVHTFPEHASLCLNLFCCTPRAEWDFAQGLAEAVGAERVVVRRLERIYGGSGTLAPPAVIPSAVPRSGAESRDPRPDGGVVAVPPSGSNVTATAPPSGRGSLHSRPAGAQSG